MAKTYAIVLITAGKNIYSYGMKLNLYTYREGDYERNWSSQVIPNKHGNREKDNTINGSMVIQKEYP